MAGNELPEDDRKRIEELFYGGDASSGFERHLLRVCSGEAIPFTDKEWGWYEAMLEMYERNKAARNQATKTAYARWTDGDAIAFEALLRAHHEQTQFDYDSHERQRNHNQMLYEAEPAAIEEK